MYIATSAPVSPADTIVNFMPHALRKLFYTADLSEVFEIRLCVQRPVSLYTAEGRFFMSRDGELTPDPFGALRINAAHISEAMELASRSSVYCVEDEIRNGYITIDGGHRIGICGSAVIRDGRIAFVKDISAMNYRIAHEIRGAADCVMEDIFCGGQVRNTLIISPPGAGKTTMLRDIARQLSDEGVRVCVVDERREIAAMSSGRTDFDLGSSTAVFSGAPKTAGMLMMLRAMSPEVIITDEIGTAADAKAMAAVINSGTKIVASAHGSGLEQLRRRSDIAEALKYFEVFVTLNAREVREIITV